MPSCLPKAQVHPPDTGEEVFNQLQKIGSKKYTRSVVCKQAVQKAGRAPDLARPRRAAFGCRRPLLRLLPLRRGRLAARCRCCDTALLLLLLCVLHQLVHVLRVSLQALLEELELRQAVHALQVRAGGAKSL